MLHYKNVSVILCTNFFQLHIATTLRPRCVEFDVRLTNSSFYSTQNSYIVYVGNVEVCINGNYVAICDIGWDDEDTQAACNFLGYQAPIYRTLQKKEY